MPASDELSLTYYKHEYEEWSGAHNAQHKFHPVSLTTLVNCHANKDSRQQKEQCGPEHSDWI